MRNVLANKDGSHFFSTTNKQLIATIKQLGIKNIRVGGNTADRATIPLPNATDVDNLFAFAKRANVKVIYTLRLNHGDPESDATMASYIEKHYAKQLDCFVIGNEPNTYYTSNYPGFLADWKRFDAVITATTNAPQAKFCGPSVSPGHEKWSAQFAAELASGGQIKFISQHDYPGGDARKVTNPALSRDKILSPAMEAHYATFASHFVPTVISNGLAYRFEEANSFYDGGAQDVSDTFASALWALDYEWWWASHGAIGINFHTGDNVAARDETKPCRYATFWTTPDGYNVHPIGYAEKMFSLGSRGRMVAVNVPSELETGLNFTIYAVMGDDKNFYVTLINRSHGETGTNLTVSIGAQGVSRWSKASIMELATRDGDISRKTGVTLGGGEISDDGRWDGKWQAVTFSKSQSSVTVEVPAASAMIVKLASR
jgi:hypothetical protein